MALAGKDEKHDRQRRREAAVKDLNDLAASVVGEPRLSKVDKRAPGALVADLHNKLLSDCRLTPGQRATLQRVKDAYVTSGGNGAFADAAPGPLPAGAPNKFGLYIYLTCLWRPPNLSPC